MVSALFDTDVALYCTLLSYNRSSVERDLRWSLSSSSRKWDLFLGPLGNCSAYSGHSSLGITFRERVVMRGLVHLCDLSRADD